MKDIVLAAARVCTDHFSVNTLDVDAVVATTDRERTMKLLGWDQEKESWRLHDLEDGDIWATQIFDPNLCRAVVRALGGTGSTKYDHQLVIQLAEFALELLEKEEEDK